jgi:protein Mpv17
MLLGEIFVQRIKNHNKYDFERIKQSAVVGLSQGSMHHFFYLWMERIMPGKSKAAIIKKILLDQFIISPIFISHFLYTSYFLEGKKLKDIHDIIKQKFLKIYVADWAIWPLSQTINFCYVPFKYRVLYVNVISLFYSTFLCYVKHSP